MPLMYIASALVCVSVCVRACPVDTPVCMRVLRANLLGDVCRSPLCPVDLRGREHAICVSCQREQLAREELCYAVPGAVQVLLAVSLPKHITSGELWKSLRVVRGWAREDSRTFPWESVTSLVLVTSSVLTSCCQETTMLPLPALWDWLPALTPGAQLWSSCGCLKLSPKVPYSRRKAAARRHQHND